MKGRPYWAIPLDRGLFHLPVGFYRMKIGPFLAEIWPKTSRKASRLGLKGAALKEGTLNGEFTVLYLS